MKKILITTTTLCLSFCVNNAIAQGKKGAKSSKALKPNVSASQTKKQLSPEEEQKIWMEYAEPSPIHKMMAQSDGVWRAETTQWMKPGMDPMKSEGKCENKMIMGGRYQISNFSGNMMGMPFEGMGILGYDNSKQEFVNTWVDNFGTGIMMLKGKWNDEKKCINFTGTMTDPTTKGEIPVRQVFINKDENTQLIEMYIPNPDGKGEFKTMEIIFTRG